MAGGCSRAGWLVVVVELGGCSRAVLLVVVLWVDGW